MYIIIGVCIVSSNLAILNIGLNEKLDYFINRFTETEFSKNVNFHRDLKIQKFSVANLYTNPFFPIIQ